ncbi:Monocarboxylate transporter 14 [Eumeta japonica]|uniref:Monocarboxylate transporter 14 n=1 Tax=Eumeta variegata TaxID=151549 RepID=A0A4C1WZ84_EUMVA|nr:Monocarboxylate transporter 14 [Eumeta japonica]
MDSQRTHINGVPLNDKKYAWNIPDDAKADTPFLYKGNGKVNAEVKAVNLQKPDLNTVNSIKTDAKTAVDKPSHDLLTVNYSKEKNGDPKEEDRASTNEGVKFLGLGDGDSICSSKPPAESAPQIPDGGWGWVVVIASFLIATVADGLAFSYGLVHEKFLESFQGSQAKTSLIGSLFISVPLIAGPVMSALVDRYGCRKMTIVGGIASTIGFLAAAFSPSVEVLCVTYGMMAGLGMGLLYVTAVVSIAYWFDKRRNLAVGLGSCGVGFGTFVYAPLTTYLLDEYGWRGAIILLAGTVLNVCVCGAVMRDPEWWITEQKKQRQLNKSKRVLSSASISAKSGGGESVFPGVEELKSLMESGETPEYILTTLVTSIAKAEDLDNATKMNADLSQQKGASVINLPTFLKQSEKLPAEVLDQLMANKQLYNVVLENYPSLLALRSSSEQQLSVGPQAEVSKNKPVRMSMKLKLSKKEKKDFETKLDLVKEKLLQPIPENKTATIQPANTRQDWFSKQLTDHHYLKDIRVHRNSIMHRGAMMNIAKYKLRASSCPDIYRNSMWSVEENQAEKTWISRTLDVINRTFDFKMFTEFHFLMMNLSTIVLFIWFIVPYFYLPDFMKDEGYEESQRAAMLSIFGVATIIGIIGLGWAGDQPWVHVTKTYAVCLIICGFTIMLFPVIIRLTDPKASYSFYLLAINAIVFGLTFSSSYSYTPSILVELIALERFTMAYGLVLLSQGVGHLVGPPMAGGLKDMTNYWDSAFYVAGIWVMISGLLVAVIPFTRNFRMCGNAPLAKDSAPEPDPSVRIIVAH